MFGNFRLIFLSQHNNYDEKLLDELMKINQLTSLLYENQLISFRYVNKVA